MSLSPPPHQVYPVLPSRGVSLLPSPAPTLEGPMLHIAVRSPVRRRLGVGKQDQGLSPSPSHY